VVAQTATFRQGVNGYASTTDTCIKSANPDGAYGLSTDTVLVADDSSLSQGLIRFDNLFGPAAGQVPLGADILSAKLSIVTGPLSNDDTLNQISLHQLNEPFNDASTWNSLGAGVSVGAEAVATPEFTLLPNTQAEYAIFDVSDSIASFAAAAALGQNLNNGWLINPSGTDAWRFRSSEFEAIDDRPILSITYAVPQLPLTLFGDYNQNGIVDAADFTVWRDKLGQSILLPNDSTPGTVTHADYAVWRAHFGQTVGGGAAAGVTALIPEPETFVMLILAAFGTRWRGRQFA
jgi:hypothetical protein